MLKLLELAESRGIQILRRKALILVDQKLQWAQPSRDVIANCGVAGFGERLRELAYAEVRFVFDLAGIGLLVSGDESEQGRFTGAVAPDEAHPLTRLEHERGLAQYEVVADLVAYGVDGQKRHQRRDYRHFVAMGVHRGVELR